LVLLRTGQPPAEPLLPNRLKTAVAITRRRREEQQPSGNVVPDRS
jgi:hypothetical protein